MKQEILSTKFIWVITIIGLLSCNDKEEDSTTTTETQLTGRDTALKTTISTMNTAMVKHAEATISATYPDTVVNGTVKFDADSAGKVTMMINLTVPSKAGKTIAVHIHEHGDCADTAKAAHGHWNPTNAMHGKWGSENFHSGDIGNIKLDAKGNGTLSLTTDLWTLGGKPDKNILGKTIIVHGSKDDYKSQPAGNSGTRIGCGIIRQ